MPYHAPPLPLFRPDVLRRTGAAALLPFPAGSGSGASWWYGALPTDPLSLFGLAVVGLLVLTLMLLNQRKKRIISTKTQALAETEAGYRLLFEHSPMPLVEEDLSAVRVLLDNLQSGGVSDLVAHFRTHPGDLALCAEEARIVAANRATLALYGAGEPGLLTRLATILPDDPGEGYAAELAGLHRAGRSETRTHSRTLDGLPLLVERRAVVAAGHEQDWAKVFVTIIDLTEQERLKQQHKEFERQLEQTRKLEAIGSLAGGIAHDFNNLLAPILGRAELLSAEKGDDPIVAEHSRAIVDASRRARALVRQILTFSRNEPPRRTAVALAEVMHDTERLLRVTLPPTVELHMALPQGMPPVLADPTQVEQALLNLCTNAIHALGESRGTVQVAATPARPDLRLCERLGLAPGDYVAISVRDNGPGMDAAMLERVFEPFFTTKPVGQGTGLGLSVVHGVMGNHAGAVDVQSTPGKGSLFTLYFPAATPPALAIAPAEPALPLTTENTLQPSLQQRSRHVIYVDDDQALVFLVQRLLRRRGYQVSGFTDPREAAAVLRADPQKFDLLVTDYNMPGYSGVDLLREVRDIRPDLPVALASGHVTAEIEQNARAAGARALIHKPNDVQELCDTVDRLVHGDA